MRTTIHGLVIALAFVGGIAIACRSEPPSAEPCPDDDDSCLATDEGDGDGDTSCVGPQDCPGAAAPFCDLDSGECVGCDATAEPDDACASLGTGVPVCVDGICRECAEGKGDACGGTTPICDVVANACTGCLAHAECSESACNFLEGNCFDPATIIHVNGTTPCAGGDGSEATPYCTIGEALEVVGGEGMIVLHDMETSPFAYTESNTVQTMVALFAAPGDAPVIQGIGGAPGITVAATGNLFMRGITIAGTQNDAQGLLVTGGAAWVEHSKIVNNGGGGIRVESSGVLMLATSFVGGDVADRNAVHVADGYVRIWSSTLAGGGLGASALFCDDNALNAQVRNSLLVASTDGDELACAIVYMTESALEMAVADNVALGAMPPNPDEWFVDYAGGDFHLAATHPAAIDSAALWILGDLPTDIDGDPRPTVHGTPDFAGADVVP